MTSSSLPEPAPAGGDRERLLEEIHLRYTAPGHLRFSLPGALCTSAAASALERGLVRRQGVYRVKLFRDNRKLSVRFHPSVIDLKQIGLALSELVLALPVSALVEPEPATDGSGQGEFSLPRLRLPALAGKLLSQRKGLPAQLLIDKETEQKATAVLNEIVLFYLVKLHWDVIANRLIKRPLRNTGPWLTIFYLSFLYVKHKKEP